MSRIQRILEKAEGDGSVRRLWDTADGATAPSFPSEPLRGSGAGKPRGDVGASLKSSRSLSGGELHPLLVAALAPQSATAEQYRALWTRIPHNQDGSAVRVVLVTSPGRGEGKSLTAAALGLTLANENQRRICLVDADLRTPRLQRLFGVPDGPGLSDVIVGDSSLDDVMVPFKDGRLTIVTAGHAPVHPAKLPETSTMRSALDPLRARFDHVVMDAPSAVPPADVGILAPLVDGVLLVVRAGMTSKLAIHDAIGAIDRSKLLGIVLNDAV